MSPTRPSGHHAAQGDRDPAAQQTRRDAQLALLNGVSREIARELELEALLILTVNLLHTTFGFEHVGFLTVDLPHAQLQMAACAGIYASHYAKDHHLPLNQGLTAWAYHHEQTVVVNDVTRDTRYINLYPDRVPTQSELAAPIWVSGEIVGILDVQDAEKNAFDSNDVILLETVADQLAVAVGNAQLYKSLQEQLEERLRAEASLAASREQLVLALEGGDLGTWDWDLTTGVVSYNDRWATMLGYDPSKIKPTFKAWANLIHSGDLPHVKQALREHLTGVTESYVAEHRMRAADGTWHWISTHGRVLRHDTEGQPLRISGTQQDITARKESEAALKTLNASLEAQVAERTSQLTAERDYTRAILETTGDAIARINLDLNIEYVNPAFEEITGFSADEARGRHAPDLINSSPLQTSTIEDMRTTVNKRTSWTGEMTLRRRSGQTYDALIQISSVRDAQGTVTGYLTSHRDISNLKTLQRTQTRFISNVSHELRTPISVLSLYAGMLPEAPPDRRRRYETALQDEIAHLSQLVENILRMNTLSTRGLRPSPTPISLNLLLKDVIAKGCPVPGSAGQPELRTVLSAEDPVADIDVSLLTEAIGHILNNAIRYTPPTGTVTVATAYQERNTHTWATIAIRDTGIGIPTEEQPHLFESFYRGQQPDTEQISGTGLGLSIARAIVELHGGEITIESTANQGSTFTIWLQSHLSPTG